MAFASLGRVEESLDALELAVENGFRMRIDFEYFLALEDYPFTKGITRLPRYALLVSRIEEENGRMRENLLASRR
jgi:hypothetical protein